MPQAAEYEQVLSKPDIAMMQATPPEEATHYLKQVIEFQRAHADLFWRGRFTDDQGFTCSRAEGDHVLAKSFVAGDRVGVLVWNVGDRPSPCAVRVPNAELVSASEPGQSKTAAGEPLAPHTVRLLVWKKSRQ